MEGFQTFGERTVHGPLLRFAQPIQLDFSMAALRFVLGNVISYRSPTLLLARLSHAGLKKQTAHPSPLLPPSFIAAFLAVFAAIPPPLSLFSSRKNVHKEVVGGRSAFLIRNSPFDNNFLNEKKRKEGELLDDLNFEQRKWNYNLPSFLLFPFFAYRWRDLFDIILPLEKVPNEFDFFPTNHRVGREKGGEELSHRAVRGGYSIGVLISARSLIVALSCKEIVIYRKK